MDVQRWLRRLVSAPAEEISPSEQDPRAAAYESAYRQAREKSANAGAGKCVAASAAIVFAVLGITISEKSLPPVFEYPGQLGTLVLDLYPLYLARRAWQVERRYADDATAIQCARRDEAQMDHADVPMWATERYYVWPTPDGSSITNMAVLGPETAPDVDSEILARYSATLYETAAGTITVLSLRNAIYKAL
jgi:hypothetical protein